jgi:hypothetical protein
MLVCEMTPYSLVGRYHFSDERTSSTFTVDAREVQLLHISCALFPLAPTGIWLLSPPVNLSCNLTVPRVYLKHFHPADGSKNSFRTLISGRIEMGHTEIGCFDMSLIEMIQE